MGTSSTPLQYVIVDRQGAFFIEPDLFENNVTFANTTTIYLINLLLKIMGRIRVKLRVALF